MSWTETFRYDLLDSNDNIVGSLDVPKGGTLDFSVSAEIRGSGSIVVHKAQDWLHSRVRVSYNDIALITALTKVPSEDYSSTSMTAKVDLYDKLIILSDDNFGAAYAVAAGTNIVDKVVEIIASTGELKVAIEPSTQTLTNNLVWDANTSKLKIVNDLLDAANYFSLWCDGLGFYRSTPYVAPQSRGIKHAFIDNEQGLYLPAFTRNYDPYSVPNRFIVIGKTDGEVEALVKTATDESGGPYSYPGRPWLTKTLTDVEYVDAANLQAIADRKLIEARQVSETFEIVHPYLGFGLNDLVTFTNKGLGKTASAVCQKQSYSLQTGGLIKSTIRTVI